MSKFRQSLLTISQAKELIKYGYYGYVTYVPNVGRIATVDDAIDWLRKKHNIIIYNSIEPFVDPTEDNHHILYRFSVKYCNLRDGWNGRIYIGESKLTKNIYAAKRQAIWLAIRYLNKQNGKKKNL